MPAPDPLSATPSTHGEVVAAVRELGQFVADGGGAARLLSGLNPPASGAPVPDPLDGVSDPWRWSDIMGGWVSPASEVSWEDATELPGISAELDILVIEDPAPSLLTPVTYSDGGGATTSAGSGVAYVVQYEPGFAHTVVPDATLDAESLLPGFTFGAPYEFVGGTGDGEVGDFWIIDNPDDYYSNNHVYGPKGEMGWGSSRGMLLNPNSYQIVNEPWFFYGADAEAPIQLKGGTEPADIDISPGDVGIWYEPTTGAPVIHFKGKDDAGTVFSASITLT